MIGGRRVAKTAYYCEGGPFNGQTLYLASASTAYLEVQDWLPGRYIRLEAGNIITWQKKEEDPND